jgi:hypothetical protein
MPKMAQNDRLWANMGLLLGFLAFSMRLRGAFAFVGRKKGL